MDVAFGGSSGQVSKGEVGPAAETMLILTRQEVQCLRWCKEGKTNWEIGGILRISEKTVEFHLGNTMKKLGAGNRITAVVVALRMGLITL